MRLRNAVVSLFGLKTGDMDGKRPEKIALKTGQKVGMFRVYEVSETEVILGEDDRHLNFRVSVFLDAAPPPDRGHRRLTVTTVVHFNNAFGRFYFFLVKPVHRLIVPAMFRRMLSGHNHD